MAIYYVQEIEFNVTHPRRKIESRAGMQVAAETWCEKYVKRAGEVRTVCVRDEKQTREDFFRVQKKIIVHCERAENTF